MNIYPAYVYMYVLYLYSYPVNSYAVYVYIHVVFHAYTWIKYCFHYYVTCVLATMQGIGTGQGHGLTAFGTSKTHN